MSRSKEDIRKFLVNELKNVCDNVSNNFVHPEEHAELNGEFPYITITFENTQVVDNSKMALQNLSIIGFVKSDNETLSEKIDQIEGKILKAIYRKGLVVEEIDNTNIFKPFGLTAGVYPPYGAVRFRINMARVLDNLDH
jgi:hypothetical protein